jgi:hypothetical protein
MRLRQIFTSSRFPGLQCTEARGETVSGNFAEGVMMKQK